MKGLKSKITLTLIASMGLSMLLIATLIISFWQQSNVKTHIRHLQKFTTLNLKNQPNYSSPIGIEKLKANIKDFSPHLSKVIFAKNGDVIGPDEISADTSILLEQVQSSNRSSSKAYGFTLHLLSFSRTSLTHVFPVKIVDKNGETSVYQIILKFNINSLIEDSTSKQLVIVFYILVNTLVFGTIAFFRLVRSVIKPIDRLISLSENYTGTQGLLISDKKITGEFSQLSLALNSMLLKINEDKSKLKNNIKLLETVNKQLIESQKNLIRAEKLAAVGKLTAGLAHEIGNPIGIVQGYLDLLGEDDISDQDKEQFVIRATKELSRVDLMIRQLLDFSRKQPKTGSDCHAFKTCQEATTLAESQKNGLEIQIQCNNTAINDFIGLGADDLYQVLLNCLINSKDAIQDRGRGYLGEIIITCSNSIDRQYVIIEIEDNGTGIPTEHLNSVFDPFFTTKDIGKGTGLGLSVSYSIIESASGSMEIESTHESGTKVTITLPILSNKT